MLDTTGAPFDAGFVRFAATLPLLVMYLPAGVVADRYDRRRVMMATELTRLVAVGTLAGAIIMDAVSLAHVVAVSLVVGSASAVFQVTEFAAIPRIVPAAQRQAALAQNAVRFYASLIAGQTAGGVLYALGRAVPFVVDAASYLISLVSVSLIRTPLQEPHAGRRPAPVREGLAWLWASPLLRTTTLLVAGNNLVVNSLYLALIVHAQRLGASPSEIGVMLASIGVSGLAGSAVARRLAGALSFRQVTLLALGVKAVLIPLLLAMPHAYALAIPFGAMFFVDATWGSVVGARQLSVIPDRLQGRVNGAIQLVGLGTVPLGALLVGALLQAAGSPATILVFGAVMAATTIVAAVDRTIAAASRERSAADAAAS